MALQVWLPLINNIENQGVSNVPIINNGVTFVDGGKIGNKCASFNGNYFSLQNLSNFNTISVSFWMKPANTNQVGCLLNYRASVGVDLAIFLIDGKIRFDAGGRTIFNYTYTTDWQHITVTYDGNVKSLYINGILNQSVTVNKAISCNATKGTVGASSANTISGSSNNYIGLLNDYRIYDHCLSPKEVKEIAKGLVLHYPLNDAYVEGTVNINNSKTITDTCYNGATGQYNYGPTTDMYKVDGIFQGKQCTKVYMETNGLDAHPFVSFHPLHPANGAYKTLSFDYFPTICNNIVFYTYGGSATTSYVVNGIKSTSSDGAKTIPVNIGQWNHIEFTLLGTSDSTGGWSYMQIGNTNHTSSTSNYWLFANVQIEEKDHATPYTPNTRNETTVYDCSGYQNNGTINGSLSCSADSPRYKISTHFTSSIPSRINLPSDMSCLSGNNEQTLSCWVKSSGLGSGMIQSGLIALGYGNSLFLSDSDYWYRIDNGSDLGIIGANQNPHDGKWHLVTATYKSGIASIYIDGVLKNNVSRTFSNRYINTGGNRIGTEVNNSPVYNLNGDISDIRMYTTALSADDIKELYNTSAYVSDNGTLLTYNLEE